MSQCWISKQRVDTGEDAVDLRDELLHSRQHRAHRTQHALIDLSLYRIAGLHTLARVVGQEQIHLHIAHQVTDNLSGRSFGNAEIIVHIELHHDVAIAIIVVVDILHHTHLIAIGVDRIGT